MAEATVTDSVALGNATPASTFETGTLTPSGANKVIWALVGSGATAPNNVTAVKYASAAGVGGESLTQQGATLAIGANEKISLWRLIAPAAASGTIWAQYGGTDDERWIIGVAVQDADQTTPNDTVATATGSSLAPSANAVSVTGRLVLDFMSFLDVGGTSRTCSVGGGQTQLKNLGGGAISAFEGAGSSSNTAAGASTTMSWTVSGAGSVDWGTFAFSVIGAAAAGASQQPDSSQILMGQIAM